MSASRAKHRLVFQPMGVRTAVAPGETLRTAARLAGVAIDSICGERATCGKCKVKVLEGEFPKLALTSRHAHLSPRGEGEAAYWQKREKGLRAQGEDPAAYRLSCQAQVLGDAVIVVPESSQAARQVVRKAARERKIDVRPMLRKIYLELAPATLADPRADWTRLKARLAELDPLTRGPYDFPLQPDQLTIGLAALQDLQETVRAGAWGLTVTVRAGGEVVRVEPGYSETLVGLAIDIGTTTIVGHLCDLRTGQVLATADMMNPQIGFGEDVMSRMSYANEAPDGFAKLHQVLIQGLNQLARQVARRAGTQAGEILDLVVVGNTVMHHFLAGLSTRDLGRAPYVPAVHDALDLRAPELGLTSVHPGARVHLLPIVASFVGPDAMAVLLSEAPYEQEAPWLIVDVGTNAELVLGNRDRLICTSTPTGPAFEGAHIEYGLRAAPGAIERVVIDPETLVPRIRVIGSDRWSDEAGAPPAQGICGTGIIDAVAELYRVGLVKPDGQFDLKKEAAQLQVEGDRVAYVLAEASQTAIAREIPITQEDVRQIQLAKAPLYVAAQYLLKAFGLDRPERILLAGGFGSQIDPEKAMLLGMIPDVPLDRVQVVGNAAGEGARIALVNREKRLEAQALMEKIERLELPAQPGFQDQFTLALHFPHMVDPYPHLEGRAPPREVDPLAKRLFGDNIPEI